MLSKINRLPGSKIPSLFVNSKTYHTPLFILKLNQREKHEAPQVGFIVSTKISKIAVKRNKIKRLLRQAFKDQLNKLPQGSLLLVVAKPSIIHKTLIQIKKTTDEISFS